MKVKTIGVLILLALTCAMTTAIWANDLAHNRNCDNCGMDRKTFSYSRVLLRLANGSQIATCSLNCAVEELEKHKGQKVREFLVADYDTRTLIAAPSAFWVMGGDRPGVMTMRPKWAFAGRRAAEAFTKAHGGTVVGWQEIFAAAKHDAAAMKM